MSKLAPRLPAGLKALAFDSTKKCGVYFLFYRGDVVYVGSSRNMLQRIGQHSLDKDFDDVQWIETSLRRMRATEGHWILALKPKYNGYTDARGVRMYNAPKPTAVPRTPGVISRRLQRLMNDAFREVGEALNKQRLSGVSNEGR